MLSIPSEREFQRPEYIQLTDLKYCAIVTCRNSEAMIEKALISLLRQSIEPEYVIVVDDGSTDKTPIILKTMLHSKEWASKLHIITNPDLGYDPSRIVRNWNKALAYADQKGLTKTNYHLIATDDIILERDYALKVLTRMGANPDIAIASGIYDHKGHVARPHGAGRFMRNSFFSGPYPEKMGYESYVLHLAQLQGFSCTVIENAYFEHVRPLGKDHHFREFGASMRTLGYHPLSVLARVAQGLILGRGMKRLGALYMLYYYLTYRSDSSEYNSYFDEKFRQSVSQAQMMRLRQIIGLP